MIIVFRSGIVAGQYNDDYNSILVSETFADFPVTMCMYTVTDDSKVTHQYICYYDINHDMKIAYRNRKGIDDDSPFSSFSHYKLNSKIEYDSHNYITMCVDNDGFIHVMGNMHADSLRYWKSADPWDPSNMKSDTIADLVGRVITYPCFIRSKINDEIYFLCRTGISGKGDEQVYIYKRGKWIKCNTAFVGKEDNAYIKGVAGDLGFDIYNPYSDCYEFLYLWRETPDASTCKQLSFARTKDFKVFSNYTGKVSAKFLNSDNNDFVVDNVPIKGGLLNTAWRICFCKKGTFVAYHKYDENQNSQIYLVGLYKKRLLGPIKVTDWSGRWEFGGVGTGPSVSGSVDFAIGEELYNGKKNLWVQCNASFGDNKRYYYDEKNLKLVGVGLPECVSRLPHNLFKLQNEKLKRVHLLKDLNDSSYFLRYESLDPNRDKPCMTKVFSKIYVIEVNRY